MFDQFENDVAAMFAQAPDFDDEARFAAGVDERIERYVRLRRRVLWVLTVFGASGVGAIVLSSSLIGDLVSLGQGLVEAAPPADFAAGVSTMNLIGFSVAICLGGLGLGRVLKAF